jgi:hypothetical protein
MRGTTCSGILSHDIIEILLKVALCTIKQTNKLWNNPSMQDIYSRYRDLWNAAIYKWKVRNGTIEIISFVVKFGLNRPSLSILTQLDVA